MLKTRLTELLKIEYPIIQAPMNWITGADLVAAVSAAGGLGTLGPNAGQKTPTNDPQEVGERLRGQIRKVRSITDKPFAVNVAIGSGDFRKFSDACVRVVIEEKVAAAIVVMGGPQVYTKMLQDAGVKVLQAISTVRHAQRAEAEGVDAVITESIDGGGHLGAVDHTNVTLVPQVVDAVKIPVVAGGGIVDARGLVAVLALGADGAYIGTRFLATKESDAHPNMKEAVLRAGESDTMLVGKKTGTGMFRLIKNDFARQFQEMEMSGAAAEELDRFWASHIKASPGYLVSRMYGTFCLGDTVQGCMLAGGSVGAINELLSAGEVVRNIVTGASAVLQRLNKVGV